MEGSPRKGYDAAQTGREEDDLDRWRFAIEIVEVTRATPLEWSARIGVFGKWGEGKSTVLKFSEDMLKKQGDLVFWFNPWAVQNWNELWTEFGDRLIRELEDAGIVTESVIKRSLRSVTKKLGSSGVGGLAETAAVILRGEKVYASAFGLLRHWLSYDGQQIREIRKKLGSRRIVVLVDDLDRCAPDLIPQLLLSLRELLDLPGFTFILAFDEEIVSEAIARKNPAWGGGMGFLEKILDFRFYLPRVSERQKSRLILRAVSKYCPFVPVASCEEIQDLLPDNPRRLKALIRSMAALEPQISRHDPDELNWVDIWLVQLLRQESDPFFELLLEGDTYEKEAGTLYRLTKSERRTSLKGGTDSKKEDHNHGIRDLTKKANVNEQEAIERIIKLIEAVRSRASDKFRYCCDMVHRPHAITWKEFRSLYSDWAAKMEATTLSSWIERHSKIRIVERDDVRRELFETILSRRQGLLSSAADAESLSEHDLHSVEATNVLIMAKQFLEVINGFEPLLFRRLFDQVAYWIGFRKNPGDLSLREREEAVLLDLLERCPRQQLLGALEVLVQMQDPIDMGDGTFQQRKVLRAKCLAVVAQKAAEETLEFLKREGAVRSLEEGGRHVGVKYCLFNRESPLWNTSLKAKLLSMICPQDADHATFVNARDLLDLIVQALEYRSQSVTTQDAQAACKDAEFIRCVWKTATSREIQYRMQIAFIRYRHALIEGGASEDDLPLTAELQSRLDEDRPKPKDPSG